MNAIVKVMTLESGIVQISLNRPEQLNALNQDTLVKLSQIFEDIKNDKGIKAILLTGEGKGFCAGADIKELLALNGNTGFDFAEFGQSVFNQLESIGKPSVAAIHGFAFGGGCELAMAATMRIATTKTVLGQPEIKLGVIPGFGGTQRLPRLIGKGRALDHCLTGKRFTAEQALQWGWLSEVTPEQDLLPRAIAILKELILQSPLALRSIMAVINAGYDLTLEQALALEASHFGLCCSTADKQEGVQAFLEKRQALFKGE